MPKSFARDKLSHPSRSPINNPEKNDSFAGADKWTVSRSNSLSGSLSSAGKVSFFGTTPFSRAIFGRTFIGMTSLARIAAVGISTLAPLSHAQQQNLPDTAHQSDWHPASTLTDEQRARLKPGCDGLYIDPMQAVANSLGDGAKHLENYPLEIDADQSEVREGETAILEGSVDVTQGARRIHADKMTYQITTDQAALEGQVAIRQPGVLIQGSEAKANGIDHSASFKNAEFLLHQQHLRGSASTIRQTPEKIIKLENGSFTSCEPGSNTWVFEGEEIIIDTLAHQGSGKNIRLRIMDVPVIWLPYVTFPVGEDRKSGLLFPSVSISERNGLDVSIPYYFNLAPNYDATITPRIIGKRGAMLETEGRHLSENFYTTANMSVLVNDRGGRDPELDKQIEQGEISEDEALPYIGKNRWLGHFRQQGGTSDRWYSEIDAAKASDIDYFRDLGISSFSLQNTTHLNQSISGGYRFDNWEISGLVQNYQILLYDVDDPYQRLPQINFNGNYYTGDLELDLINEYTRFGHNDDYWRNGKTIIKGQRLTTDYSLNINKRSSWGFFHPTAGLQTLSYQLDKETIAEHAESTPTIATGFASFDTGLIFEHTGGEILQTLEPRLYYLYRSYDNHEALFNVTDDGQSVNFDTSERTFSYSQLYRDSRFSGSDRLEDANRMTMGLTSNWYSNASGEEYLSVSLGQIFYFNDQQVSLDQSVNTQEKSEFAGELRVRLGRWGRFMMSSIYDGDEDQFTRGNAGIQFATPDYQRLFNLSYSYIRNNSFGSAGIDQLDTSFVSPLSKQWSTMGRYNYDYGEGRELEAFAGLEYNDCCYRVRLLARRWLDSNIAAVTESDDALYDQGIFFELQLKGLGSSGAKVDPILEDSIFGYREREQRLNQ